MLIQAFRDYPFAESYGLKPAATRKIFEASIDSIGVEHVWTYGIWKEDNFVCVSISVGKLPIWPKMRVLA